jgi:integrase
MADPFDELKPPDIGREPRLVYRPEDLRKLLETAIATDGDICRFIALSALAFFRTRELVRRLDNEPVLEWRDILWDRNEIHVREEVGKHTRRSSNERFTPIHSALGHVLDVTHVSARTGRVVDCSVTAFQRRRDKVFKEAGVEFIDNGLRKSAISHWLSAHPEHGVGEVARYAGNSEPSCRAHYIRILTKAQGEAWFDSAIVF